jgi:DNA-binding NarL/FixJ family response regulator
MVVRIVLAEDNDTVRHLLKSLLEAQLGWNVVAEVRDGRSAIETTRELNPDIVILDFDLPGLNGIDATREIVKELPDMRILVLTVHDSEWLVRLALSAGARCCLLKSEVTRRLMPVVESMIA